MKINFTKTNRLPKFPKWIFFIAIPGFLIQGSTYIFFYLNSQTLCLIKRFTGIPCPLCGSTRLAISFFNGQILTGIRMNPMVFLICIVLGFVATLKLIFGLKPVFTGNKTEGITLWIIGSVIFLANWIFLIWDGR